MRRLDACRASGSKNLIPVLSLGRQKLTGVFPRDPSVPVAEGPLDLMWCPDSGLLQLGCSYDSDDMYGENYGYRSGLNESMVRHLTQKVAALQRLRPVGADDWVVDIGSNDATTLKAYEGTGLRRVGVDPTGQKFRRFYPDDIALIADFFSADSFKERFGDVKASIITAIAMFYDLERPLDFVREVHSILADDGIWHFEQSYMPSMMRTNSYDTICHEHLEYYSLGVVKAMLEKCDFRIIDVRMNAVNGGSFAVTACKTRAPHPTDRAVVEWLLEQEDRMGLFTPRPFRDFEERVFEHRANLTRLIRTLNADGKRVIGYGASTKGNVLLQFCGLGVADLPAIAELNPDKLGCFTPGTNIPIVSEEEAKCMKPDYFLVLPWHFKESILRREQEWLQAGGRMIFPLPEIEIVGG
jgi:hypothetical protein